MNYNYCFNFNFFLKPIYLQEKINKQQIDLLEDNEKELARKNVSNLKVIRLLTEKCRTQENIIVDLEDKLNDSKDIEAHQEQHITNLEKKLCLNIF